MRSSLDLALPWYVPCPIRRARLPVQTAQVSQCTDATSLLEAAFCGLSRRDERIHFRRECHPGQLSLKLEFESICYRMSDFDCRCFPCCVAPRILWLCPVVVGKVSEVRLLPTADDCFVTQLASLVPMPNSSALLDGSLRRGTCCPVSLFAHKLLVELSDSGRSEYESCAHPRSPLSDGIWFLIDWQRRVLQDVDLAEHNVQNEGNWGQHSK